MMRALMRTSLVIPTLNGGPLLGEVLTAIDRQPGAAELERVAVDSGSRDGTVELLARHGFAVHRIERAQFNHGATRDFAIAKTHGEVIVLLTQDAVPANDEWLPRLVECYSDPQVGAAYCRQIPRPDCNPFIAHRLREWTAGRSERVVQRIASAADFEALAPMERLRLCAYDNVAGSVRRAAWEQSPFGHRRFGEDVAFGKRSILAGYSIVYEPASAVIHSHNRTPREEGKRIYCDHQNLRELFGVHLLPTYRAFRDNVAWSRRHYGEIVAQLDLPEDQRSALARWARSYAFWGAVGMYCGGNSERLMRGRCGWLFRNLDRWMHRGI